jgi:hypothetical protein
MIAKFETFDLQVAFFSFFFLFCGHDVMALFPGGDYLSVHVTPRLGCSIDFAVDTLCCVPS